MQELQLIHKIAPKPEVRRQVATKNPPECMSAIAGQPLPVELSVVAQLRGCWGPDRNQALSAVATRLAALARHGYAVASQGTIEEMEMKLMLDQHPLQIEAHGPALSLYAH